MAGPVTEQLPLLGWEPSPHRGEPLAAFRLSLPPHVASRHRSRAVCIGGKWQAVTYPDPDYRKWKDEAVEALSAYWAGPPLLHAIIVRATFMLERPSKKPGWLSVKGEELAYPFEWTDGRNPSLGQQDLDNLRKAVLDACVQAGVIRDDRLVVQDEGTKWYAAVGEDPCTEVRVWRSA